MPLPALLTCLRRVAGVLVAVAALAPPAAPAHELGPPFGGATHDCLADASAEPTREGGFYEGRLADGTRVQANLPYVADAAARSALMPTAFWLSGGDTGEPVQATMRREATAAGDGADVVVESDGGAAASWRLAGRFSADRTRIEGTLTLPGRAGAQAVVLVRVAEYRGLHLVLPQAAAADATADAGRPSAGPDVFDALWPELADAQVSAQARGAATACHGAGQGFLSEAHGVTVAWHGPGALALRVEREVMPAGAAHPAEVSWTLNFAGDAPALRPITLDDVLDPAPSCRGAATAAIQAALRERALQWPEDGGLRPRNFLALPGGLAFFFEAGEIDARFRGPQTVFLPAAAVAGCLRALPDSGEGG